MEPFSLYSLLGLGFSLGLLHALDADHIMAVSLMASKTRTINSRLGSVLVTMGYSLRWALGHSASLLVVGGLLFLFGITLPASIQVIAEKLVGVFLILLGVLIAWQVWKNRIQLQVHQHGDISHVHLIEKKHQTHSHKPVLLGAVHGLAGSAPVLAIIPALASDRAVVGLGYLSLFSIGVMLSMMLFGLLLGRLQHWLHRFGNRVFQLARFTLGVSSIGFGLYWLAN